MSKNTHFRARYWQMLNDGRLQCNLCPRDCRLFDRQRGACLVRQRDGDEMILTTYGRSSGFCIDPIEKKPLNHFYPGSSVLSFGTAGCNLACKFCQNWGISKSKDMGILMDQAMPEDIAAAAVKYGCKSVAFTYNDPVIYAEYAMDVADACHKVGVNTVAVTAGYIYEQPRKDLFQRIDAANVDLKSFEEDFYLKLTSAHLTPVLDTLLYLRHKTNVWLEITTLIIPGKNDSEDEISSLSKWIKNNLGSDVPLHFSAFHPDHKMLDIPSTPAKTLNQAREIAMWEGLQYVYTGNIHNTAGETTFCPNCQAPLIARDWYEIDQFNLTAEGCCHLCDKLIVGRFDESEGNFGRKRIPISIGAKLI